MHLYFTTIRHISQIYILYYIKVSLKPVIWYICVCRRPDPKSVPKLLVSKLSSVPLWIRAHVLQIKNWAL